MLLRWHFSFALHSNDRMTPMILYFDIYQLSSFHGSNLDYNLADLPDRHSSSGLLGAILLSSLVQ